MIGDRPPRDPVFFMPRSRKTQGGVRPVNSNNITTRTFGPLSKLIGIKVNWHRLRATNATLTSQMLMDDDERRKMMGHGSVRMTERYTDGYVRAKGAAEAIAEGLVREGGSVQ